MGGSDERHTFRALFQKVKNCLFKLVIGHYLALVTAADLAILTKNATQITARKKYRSRAALPRYAGLLPFMDHCFRYQKVLGSAAKSKLTRRTVNTAFSRANITFHAIFLTITNKL
jgi:hypothetical protein